MALLNLPTAPLPGPGFVQGRIPQRIELLGVMQPVFGCLEQDYRLIGDTTGVILSRVLLKTDQSLPSVPVRRARVWALRLRDGYKAWEGFSDDDGYYRATGLEVGELYQMTAIDLTGGFRCTAGGPVLAQKQSGGFPK